MIQAPIPIVVPSEAELMGVGEAPQRRVLNVPYLSQTVTNWCWATCATMLSRFYGAQIRICEAAAKLIPNDGCCNGAPAEGTFDRTWNKGSCNRTCTVAEVADLHGKLGLSSTHIAGTLSFADLESEISVNGRPIEVAYSWTGGGGHVAILRGIDSQAKTVRVNDPWPDYGETVTSYNGLLTAYGKGAWFQSWRGIAKREG